MTAFALWSTVSEINTHTVAFFGRVLKRALPLHYVVCLYVEMRVLNGQTTVGSCSLDYMENLYLAIGAFRSLTFKLIVDTVEFKLNICDHSFYLLSLFCLIFIFFYFLFMFLKFYDSIFSPFLSYQSSFVDYFSGFSRLYNTYLQWLQE